MKSSVLSNTRSKQKSRDLSCLRFDKEFELSAMQLS